MSEDISDDDNTSTIVGDDDERGIDEQDQKTKIEKAFDKILKLEEKKQTLNNLISEQKNVDNVLDEINKIKKDIKLSKKPVGAN